jgi:hypothetical protein
MIRKDRVLALTPPVAQLLALLAIYGCWAAAGAQLGRSPRPMADDPASIGGFSSDLYSLCLPLVFVLFLVWLVTWLLACVMADSPKARPDGKWGLGAAAGIVAFGLHAVLFVVSPGDAVAWFYD